MNLKMLYIILLVPLVFSFAAPKEGKFIGTKDVNLPSYTSESFLDLNEDINALAQENKRLLLFVHQNNCPYCARFINKVLNKTSIQEQIKKDFALVEYNMFGDRDVVGLDGNEYTEKEYAVKLGLQFTPVVMFFDENSQKILQLNGFIKEDKFIKALQYVASKQEKNLTFKDFLAKDTITNTKKLAKNSSDEYSLVRKQDSKELLVFFNSSNCSDCNTLEEKYFKDPFIKKALSKLDVSYINTDKNMYMITPDNKTSSTKKFMRNLEVNLSPTLVFFDQKGKEIIRIDSLLELFHMQSVFDYVTSKAYKSEREFQRYLTKRSKEIRSKGIDVNIWK